MLLVPVVIVSRWQHSAREVNNYADTVHDRIVNDYYGIVLCLCSQQLFWHVQTCNFRENNKLDFLLLLLVVFFKSKIIYCVSAKTTARPTHVREVNDYADSSFSRISSQKRWGNLFFLFMWGKGKGFFKLQKYHDTVPFRLLKLTHPRWVVMTAWLCILLLFPHAVKFPR